MKRSWFLIAFALFVGFGSSARAEHNELDYDKDAGLFSLLNKGNLLTDGGLRFWKDSEFFAGYPRGPIAVWNFSTSTASQYFVADKFSVGPYAGYTLAYSNQGAIHTLTLGPIFTWFFHTYGRTALRLGGGFLWDNVRLPDAHAAVLGSNWVSGTRFNANVGMQYFFMPTISLGQTVSVDYTMGSRFAENFEVSVTGGATVYLKPKFKLPFSDSDSDSK